jgi:hypothetical protein
MRKLWLSLAVLLAAAIPEGAHAGARQTQNLAINLSELAATGALGSVRAGGGATDYIQCQVQSGQITIGDLYVECDAGNSSGSIFCRSTNANIVAVAQTIQSDSYIAFSGTSCGAGCCTLSSLNVYNGSIFAPRQ